MTSGFGNFWLGQAQNMFRGLTGHYELKPDSTKTFNLSGNYNIDFGGYSGHAENIQSQILKQVGANINSRTELLQELDRVKENELVQTLLSCLVADAFESISDDSFMSIEYDTGDGQKTKSQEIVQKEIDSFYVKHDLTGLARDIVQDWMLYGEYFLKTKCIKGQGVVDISDNCDNKDYIGLYKGRELDSYLRFNRVGGKYEIYDKDDITHFILDNNKVRVKVQLPDDTIEAPELMRVGRSVVYPVLNSLKKLGILETTALAMELKRVLSPILVSVDIPADTDTPNITDIIDKYENYLNSINMEAGNADTFSVADILQTASRIKVIPKFADNKGAIEQLRFDFDNTDLNNRINDVRKNIAMSIGVPSFMVSYGDPLMDKTNMLKVYAAYARKLVGIQTCFGNGIRDLVYKHLLYKGLYVNEHNIKIRFKSVTNVDMLDDIEVLASVLQAVESLTSFFATVAENEQFGLYVDSEALLDVYKSFTSSFPNMNGVLKLYNEKDMDKKLKQGFEIPVGGARKPVGGSTTSMSSTPATSSTPQLSTPRTSPTPPPTGGSSTPPSPTPNKPVEVPPTGGQVSLGDTF